MIVQQTYSVAGIWEPDVENTTQKKLAGPCEVTFLKLSAGGSAANVDIYDANSSGFHPTDKKWVLDASSASNDVNPFLSPIVFDKGVYAVLRQGKGFAPVISIATIPSSVR